MPLSLEVLRLLFGIVLLSAGAECLLRGSGGLARRLGVRSLVIGLIVVGYGAAAPELAVANKAALSQAAPLALATVIGSCIANISLVLGLTAIIRPFVIDARLIRRELPALVGSALAIPLLLLDGVISRAEGAALVGCAVLFTALTLTISSRDDHTLGEQRVLEAAQQAGRSYGGDRFTRANLPKALLLLAVAMGLLVVGSNHFLNAARGLGVAAGISDRVLGITLVAIGTALPELTTAIMSAWRGDGNLAVGSIVGANLLNVFLVLGVVAWTSPISLGERTNVFDLVGLVVITALAALFLRSGRQVERSEGVALVACYLAFCVATSLA